MNQSGDGGDDLNSFLNEAIEESPSPSPSPEASASPGASPTPPPPMAVRDDDLIAVVYRVHQEEQANRIANTGSFYVSCLILSVLIAAVLVSVMKRRN